MIPEANTAMWPGRLRPSKGACLLHPSLKDTACSLGLSADQGSALQGGALLLRSSLQSPKRLETTPLLPPSGRNEPEAWEPCPSM